jgi:hypothetical protein
MNYFLLMPVILSFLVLGAHVLYRYQSMPLAIVCALIPFLLFISRGWVVRVIQILLVIASIEWLRWIIIGIEEPRPNGESWHRYAIILGSVMLFTLLSGAVFFATPLHRRYFRQPMR